MTIEEQIKEIERRNCGHVCHERGLNPWVKECPICHCDNPTFAEEAVMCPECWAYPCECKK